MSMVLKESPLTIERQMNDEASRSFLATIYDATVLDRDHETLELARIRAAAKLPLQIDHSKSVLSTVGAVTGVHVSGARVRATLSFAPAGISEVADQVFRQVAAGVTSTLSIGFIGRPTRAPEGHTVWTDVEILETSFVSIPSSPGARVDGKALRAWLGKGDDSEPVLELEDEPVRDLIEDEPVIEVDDELAEAARAASARQRINSAQLAGLVDVDRAQVRAIVREVIAAAMPHVVAEAVRAELRRRRGRLD
jgi:hypothetical protein